MSIIPICPTCGTPAISVDCEVVKHFTTTATTSDKRWAACVSATCATAYFCKSQIIGINDLTQALWYKDKGARVPICYCSQLTRGEIQAAVNNGATTIDDIQSMTKRNRTGHCQRENPLGGCCRDAFLMEINKAKEHSEQGVAPYVAQSAPSGER